MENKQDKNYLNSDLQDSADDKKHLQEENTTIDLPDVEDIPGQENVKVPRFNEFIDSTISSDGEEGVGLFEDENVDGLDNDSNVSKLERSLLQKSAEYSSGAEQKDIKTVALDRTDDEGALLNEGNLVTDRFGEDLDLPESEETTEEEDVN